MSQNSTLRIFLSSTAIDIQEHRKKVSEAIQRLNNLPVGMEYFGANPNEPVDVCKGKVRESNALVVMLAHRYGWVPTKEEGGDGKKSITWIEMETALENNVPVFAFIVDEDYGWTQAKEQDAISKTTDANKIAEIVKNVQSLNEFKKFIDSKAGLTRDKFTTPEDLALKIATSLSNWSSTQTPSKNVVLKRPQFQFRIVHHLQPAPHFKGRRQLLEELKQWWQAPVTPDRVRSLVAIGGTGKTAIAERFLDSIKNERLKGSILVWSFYDEPNTDAFLREACIVFTGEEPQGAGGKLEKLQRALASENNQNLIVLDGLERIQSEGKGSSGHAKGDLEDHRLKNLLRAIAAGLGNTRALITTRFKLTDLTQWENAGYKSHDLEVLDKESAIEVLKAWEIKGDDKKLAQIAESVGYHALSVSVYGSYLNHYCDCNPEEVKEFNLNDISSDEPLAARLGRILGGYAKSLAATERDLLIRLSVFPKGVTVDILVYLIDAGGEIAGALMGTNQRKLLMIAEKLKQLGLIYSYKNENTIIYTAHPFLREYFRNLLGVKSEDIHEVVRNKLAIGLDTKPENKPTDTETLDRYEKLIEYCILAEHYHEAYNLYINIMGGSVGKTHLYHKLGDYGRAIRIISFFSKDQTPETITNKLADNNQAYLINAWGLAANALGDLKTANLCFNLSIKIYKERNENAYIASVLINSAVISLDRGLHSRAKEILLESHKFLKVEKKEGYYKNSVERNAALFLGITFHCLGEISISKENFDLATKLSGGSMYSLEGFYECERLFNLGQKAKSLERAKENLTYSEKDFGLNTISFHRIIIGMLLLPDSISEARKYLQQIREWTEKSGNMECIIRSHILAAEIAYYSGDYPVALFEATTGLNQAESCGYGKFSIDLLLLLSKIQLAIPDYKTALSNARNAMDRSANPECGYAWGEANGAHLCGVCHKALGEYELAQQRLTRALELREKIQHPEAEETRKFLAELPKK